MSTEYGAEPLVDDRGRKLVRVQQIRSPIRRHRSQRSTLIGLRLNRIGRISDLVDTPAVRGMIDKVQHLVCVISVTQGQKNAMEDGDLKAIVRSSARMFAEPTPADGVASAAGPAVIRWDVPRIIDGLRDERPELRTEALWEAAKVICEFDRSRKMSSNERLQLANIPRRMYEKLFDHDVKVAEQAAYSLVASSKSFSRNRKPIRIQDLDKYEVDRLREDLEQLLAKLGDKFYSYVDIVDARYTPDGLDADIRVRLSRELPVKLNDKPVVIPGQSANADAHMKIATLPSATAKIKRRLTPKDTAWRTGDLFIADCSVHVPEKEASKLSELPFAFAVSGLGADNFNLTIPGRARFRSPE